MFSYEYRNNDAKYHASFYDEWQRLDSCMAATFDKYKYTRFNSLGHEIKVHDFYFVSYGTPIAIVHYVYDMCDAHIIAQIIKVNINSWNCSRSTIQQLARWLRKLSYSRGISIPYSELKEIIGMIERYGYRSGQSSFPSGTGFQVVPYDYYDLLGLFHSQCPFWDVERC